MEPFPFLLAKAAITGESVKINDLLVLLLAAFLCGAAFEKDSTFSGDMCLEAQLVEQRPRGTGKPGGATFIN